MFTYVSFTHVHLKDFSVKLIKVEERPSHVEGLSVAQFCMDGGGPAWGSLGLAESWTRAYLVSCPDQDFSRQISFLVSDFCLEKAAHASSPWV